MKNKLISWCIGCVLMCAAGPAWAADSGSEAPSEGRIPSVGLGVDTSLRFGPRIGDGLSGLGGLGGLGGLAPPVTAGVRVPIRLSESFRLEPRLSFSYGSTTNKRRVDSNGGSQTRVRTTEQTDLGLGASVAGHYLWDVMDSAEAYLGLEAGLRYRSFESTSNAQSSGALGGLADRSGHATAVRGAAVLGGEYRFSPAFSLGVEAALDGTWERAKAESAGADEQPADTGFALGTRASLIARFKF